MGDWYELPDKFLRVGAKVRVFYNDGNPNNELRHIRAVVDGEYIVYRVWGHRRWRYRIEWAYTFFLLWKDGRIQ